MIWNYEDRNVCSWQIPVLCRNIFLIKYQKDFFIGYLVLFKSILKWITKLKFKHLNIDEETSLKSFYDFLEFPLKLLLGTKLPTN